MAQTVPFKIVTGTEIKPKAPFAHLYQHIRQRDPKLAETIERLAAPQTLDNNLANPLQTFTFVMVGATPSVKTNWVQVLSNVPTDMTMYFPVVAYANVDAPSTTDIKLDIFISHDKGAHFISVLTAPIVIPAGVNVPTNETITFAQGTYFRNLDFCYMQLTSVAFDGGNITANIMFQ